MELPCVVVVGQGGSWCGEGRGLRGGGRPGWREGMGRWRGGGGGRWSEGGNGRWWEGEAP